MHKILLVDDEENILTVCRRYLEKEGYHVFQAANGEEALRIYDAERIDLVVVDLMMPVMDGTALIMALIDRGKDTPFLCLSALTQEKDRLYSLTLGADDYICKPFSPRELVLRIKNIIRRSSKQEIQEKVERGSLFMDRLKRLATVNGQPLELTLKEFDLLWLLASDYQRVFSKSELLERVWGYEFEGDANTINVHIHHLREKLHAADESRLFIKTVWGLGYKFEG
ncbi:response regulator transcription factor [Paenibacillus sabinae]|nr:response regulator transcription factor [Paenibacillus sabinae]